MESVRKEDVNQIAVEQCLNDVEVTIRTLLGTRRSLKRLLANPKGFRWKSVYKAAKHVGLSAPTIYNSVNSGRLRSTEVEGKLFVDAKQLEDMFGQQDD